MNELLNKHAFVTGGTRGIGRAICLELARSGANVSFNYLNNKEAAASLVKEIEEIGRKAASYQSDVADFKVVKEMFQNGTSDHGQIDFLVNNAGITRDKALAMMEEKDWTDVINTNLNGVFNCCRSIIIPFMKRKSGKIVNITSVSGLTGMARQTNYSAAKAGIIGFTKALAKEVAGYNITVNAVAPGFIETDMLNDLSEKKKEAILDSIPLKKIGNASNIAKIVVFLLSDAANYMTGQVITADGGLAM